MAELGMMSKLVLAFVTLIIGVVLIGSIASNAQAVTTQKVVTETLSLAPTKTGADGGPNVNITYYFNLAEGCPLSGNSGWRYDVGSDCYLTNKGVKNSSGQTLIADTDYIWYSSSPTCSGHKAGDLVFKNTLNVNNSVSNTTTVTYGYCDDDYMASGWGRTGLNLVSGFFALALLLTSVGLFYSVAKDTGMI